MKTFKSYIEEDGNWFTRGVSKLTHKKAYKHAADTLKKVWARKKKDKKHGIEYYASQIAKQYNGVDARELANMVTESLDEGSESWEAGYKRRVVKTTKPEHKEKGYNWRIKGKDRPEISIKLYKEKPSYEQFKKEMKRVAGHEFG